MSGPAFGDGPVACVTIGALPLAVGYTASIRTFNGQNEHERLLRLNVVASELISVAAGTFGDGRAGR